MIQQQLLPPPHPSPPKKPLPQSLPQLPQRRSKMMIQQQLLPPNPPPPQHPVADKSPIRNSSKYLYTVITCEEHQGVTKGLQEKYIFAMIGRGESGIIGQMRLDPNKMFYSI